MKPISTDNIFAHVPEDTDREIITDLVKTGHVTVRRIVSTGQASPASGWYDQDDNEWVIVLAGEGEITFANGDSVHLRPGDFLDIPAHARHKVSWTSPEQETVWLAVHYDNT